MGVGVARVVAVSGVLDPALDCRGWREDSSISDQRGVFIIVLVIRLCHLPRTRNLYGLLAILLIQGARGAAVGHGDGLFGGFKQGEERAIGGGGWGNYWVVGGNRGGV